MAIINRMKEAKALIGLLQAVRRLRAQLKEAKMKDLVTDRRTIISGAVYGLLPTLWPLLEAFGLPVDEALQKAITGIVGGAVIIYARLAIKKVQKAQAQA